MKIYQYWSHTSLKMKCGYYETDKYIIKRSIGHVSDDSKKIISVCYNNPITPRVDMYFPIGSNCTLEDIDLVNQEPISRTIFCSSQYNVANNRSVISGDFITEFPRQFEKEYLRNLKSSMYCLSPHGHEPDCYRHWEAMYMGCIPITLKHKCLEAFYDLPILFLDSWDELTEELLLSKYEELLPRFNSEKLEEEYWVNLLETL